MRHFFSAICSIVLGCSAGPTKPGEEHETDGHNGRPEQSLVVATVGANDSDLRDARERALELGLSVTGKAVLYVKGRADKIRRLREVVGEDVISCVDDEVLIESDPSAPATPALMTLAGKEFGLTQFWRESPEADGRNVVVGLIDDGVPPDLPGLQETTTGCRKYIDHHGSSTSFTASVELLGDTEQDVLSASYEGDFDEAWKGQVSESYHSDEFGEVTVNLNVSSRRVAQTPEDFSVRVFISFGEDEEITPIICVDLDHDQRFQHSDECVGDFALTGEYAYWDRQRTLTLMARYDDLYQEVTLYPGERKDNDDHGEGVASVLTSFRRGSPFSGIAPGAQLADYDVTAPSFHPDETKYNLSAFLKGLEWMGEQGVEVVNISYSFYFFSVESQLAMASVIGSLSRIYNMVIVFSAGNNGPALGSFRRGLIYPADSIVAGAFTNAEAAEMIYGVTGLPENGRVVHYSSRGPAPDRGTAPTVVAPVATMVASHHGGYRPFAGTSSAAPAVAGVAAVLVSYVKSLGWPVDAGTVAQAIRLSARPLEGVPFVSQGGGVPRIGRAAELYGAIIRGEMFERIDAELPDIALPRMGPARGLLIKASDYSSPSEVLLTLTGKPGGTVNLREQPGMVFTYRVETNVPWLRAPKTLAISTGSTKAFLSIDENLLADVPPGGEAFGEVRLINEQQGVTVLTVPVTYIHDRSIAGAPLAFTGQVGSSDGARKHFFVPPGVQGLRVNGDVVAGPADQVTFEVVDPQGTPLGGPEPNGGEVFVAVREPGWHQVTIARSGGAGTPVEFALSLDAVQLRSIASAILPDDSIILDNYGSELEARLELRPEPLLLDRRTVTAYLNSTLEQEFPLPDQGPVLVRVDTLSGRPISAWRVSCFYVVREATGNLYGPGWFLPGERQVEISRLNPGAQLVLKCDNFEWGDEPFIFSMVWQFEILQPFDDSSIVASATARLPSGQMTEVVLNWNDSAIDDRIEEYGLYLRPITERTSSLRLGTLVRAGRPLL